MEEVQQEVVSETQSSPEVDAGDTGSQNLVEPQTHEEPDTKDSPLASKEGPLKKFLKEKEAKLAEREATHKERSAPAASEQEPEAPVYKPNYKVNVMKEEKEIPEILRPLMKDEASEKAVRDIVEKAYGLEWVKPKLEKSRQENAELTQEVTGFRTGIQELRDLYQRGDIDSFLQRMNINPEKMLQWAVDKVRYSQLPPEQKQALDARRAAEQQAYSLERQNRELNDRMYQQAAYAKAVALDSVLARADIKTVSDAFDAQKGPGKFREMVVRHGELEWYRSQGRTDLTPEQAVEQVIGTLGLRVAQQQPAPAMNATTAVQSQQPAASAQTAPAPKKPPVIPNVAGRSKSPTAQKPRSIDDLKKMAKQFD